MGLGDLLAVLGMICWAIIGYQAGFRAGKRKAVVIPVAKVVDNRVMPALTRSERRAHKRRTR